MAAKKKAKKAKAKKSTSRKRSSKRSVKRLAPRGSAKSVKGGLLPAVKPATIAIKEPAGELSYKPLGVASRSGPPTGRSSSEPEV